MSKVKRIINLLSTLILASLMAFTVSACASDKDKNKEELFTGNPTVIKDLGYLEDFGYRGIVDGRANGNTVEYYTREILEPEITLTLLGAKTGTYKGKLNEQDIGEIEVSGGSAKLSSIPQGLVLGDKYELVLTHSSAIYKQQIRYVSSAIKDYGDLARCIKYYRTYTENYKDTPSPKAEDAEKYYDGKTFSQRLYALTTNINMTRELMRKGDVKYDVNAMTDYTTTLEESVRAGCYFYDIFDGQGYSVTINDLGSNGLFGHLGQKAVVKNLKIVGYNNDWAINETFESVWDKCLLARTISSDCVIENVGLSVNSSGSIRALNVLSSYTAESVKLKDVVIIVDEGLTVDSDFIGTNNQAGTKSAGYLGTNFYPKSVEDVYVVSYGLTEASVSSSNKIYAENQIEADVNDYIIGCFYYETVDDLKTECSKIGNWFVDNNGVLTYK